MSGARSSRSCASHTPPGHGEIRIPPYGGLLPSIRSIDRIRRVWLCPSAPSLREAAGAWWRGAARPRRGSIGLIEDGLCDSQDENQKLGTLAAQVC